MSLIPLTVLLAIILDRLLGEPRRFHPVVGLGWLAHRIERYCWASNRGKLRGGIALILVLAPLLCISILAEIIFTSHMITHTALASLSLYICIAPRSLSEHGLAVSRALQKGDLTEARSALAKIVSRDTSNLSTSQVSSACCESLLENGSDGIFAAIFWFAVMGIPGVLVYRAANTLDAMWGYKNTRYLHFGWAAARFDDVLNFIPARLTACSYLLMGNSAAGWRCWRRQGNRWKSPNAGAVMSAGAGSLTLQLGGDAVYNGTIEHRPILGCGAVASTEDIARSLQLINRCLYLWLCVILLINTAIFFWW